MQRKKNYLIITIWISTIAFIGAGFVGWGSYSLSSSGAAAIVGDHEIELADINREYGRLFNLMKEQNPSFDEEAAKSINLQESAFNNLVSRAYVHNFADEIGLMVTDEELADDIVADTNFHLGGVFSKEAYQTTLEQNGLTIRDFEESYKEGLLLQKAIEIFSLNLAPLEQELSDINTKLEDEIKIAVIDSKDFKIDIKDKDLKEFWEKNKARYQTNEQYVLGVVEIPFAKEDITQQEIEDYYYNNKTSFQDAEGKIKKLENITEDIKLAIGKKEALTQANKTYYDIKNNKTSTPTTSTFDRSTAMPRASFTTITSYKAGEFVKPVELQDKYIVGRLQEVIAPQEKTYEQAKVAANIHYERELRQTKLAEKAKASVEKFKGEYVGFISKENYQEKLKSFGLDVYESNNFTFRLMDALDAKGYFIIDAKAVTYEIISQRLPTSEDGPLQLNSLKELEEVAKNDDTLLNIKSSLLQTSLIEFLKKKYTVERFVELQ